MTLRRKLKDEKLARIKADLSKAESDAKRAFQRLQRSWTKFQKLTKRISYLQKCQRQREAELDAEPIDYGRVRP